MKEKIKKILAKRLANLLIPYINAHENSLILKAARFVACEMIEGDYLEFGVYQGSSYIKAFHALKKQFEDRISFNTGGDGEERQQQKRQIKGSPYLGVQKAFQEWKNEHDLYFSFNEYQREEWKRISFIVSEIPK